MPRRKNCDEFGNRIVAKRGRKPKVREQKVPGKPGRKPKVREQKAPQKPGRKPKDANAFRDGFITGLYQRSIRAGRKNDGWVSYASAPLRMTYRTYQIILRQLIADGLIERDGSYRENWKVLCYRITQLGAEYCRKQKFDAPELVAVRAGMSAAWLRWAEKQGHKPRTVKDTLDNPCNRSGQMTATKYLRDAEFGRMIRELLVGLPEGWNPGADITKMSDEERDQWRYWYRLEQSLFAIRSAWNEDGVNQTTDGRRYYNPLVNLPKVIRRQYMPAHWEVDITTSHIQLLARVVGSGRWKEEWTVMDPYGEMVSVAQGMSSELIATAEESARRLGAWCLQNDFYGAIASVSGHTRDEMKVAVQKVLGYPVEFLDAPSGAVKAAKEFLADYYPGINQIIRKANQEDNATVHLYLQAEEQKLTDSVYQSVWGNGVSDNVMRLHDGFIVFSDDESTKDKIIQCMSNEGIRTEGKRVGIENVSALGMSGLSPLSSGTKYPPKYTPKYVPESQEPTQTAQTKEIPQMTYTTTDAQDDLHPTQDDIEPPTTLPGAIIAQEPEVETVTIIRTENHNIKGVSEEEQQRINDLLADW